MTKTKTSEQSRVNGPSAKDDGPVVTFCVPCLNEEQNICPTLETIDAAVREVGLGAYEILVIDDCSVDGTVAAAEAFCRAHPAMPIRIKTHARTMGLGHNYFEGASMGRGVHYMLVNGDNAEPLSSLVAILSRLGEADMVIPYFGDRDVRGRGRRWVSAVFTELVNVAGGRSIRYYNGPVLHLRRNVTRWQRHTSGFAYQAELITRLLACDTTYVEVQVENVDRQSGISKAFRIKNFLSVSGSLLRILLRRLWRIIMPGKPRARGGLPRRVGLAVLSLSIGLLIVEGVVRVLKLAPDLRPIDTSDPQSPYKRSDNPVLGYEIKANYRNPDADLITAFPSSNAHGQRDVERSLEKPDGVRRVILLGDSVVQSMEIRDIEQMMHRQLERLYPEDSVEVLNFGVNGYCTLAEIELLRVKGLAFQPDVVIVVFVWNDYFNLNTAMHAFASRPRRSAVVTGLFKRSHLFRAICIPFNLFGFAADANAHQWNADAIGENNVVAGLTMLKALAAEHNFVPAIAIWPQFEESQILDRPTVGGGDRSLIIERLAAFHGIPTFRMSRHFGQDHATRSTSIGPRDTYTIGDGMHPSEEGSRVAAQALKEVLDAVADPSREAPPQPSEAAYARALSTIRATEEHWDDTSRLQALRVDEVASLADAMAERGRLEDAIALCRKAIAVDDAHSPWIHESLADVLQLAGRFEEAIPHYREALRLRPGSAEVQHKWGLALDRTGRHQPAVDRYQLALLLDPSLVDAYYNLGNTLQKLDRHQEAVRNYRRTVQLSPNNVEARINLGISLYSLGDLDGALASGKEAIRLAPDDVNAHYNLAMMCLGSGQGGAAVNHFEQALKLDPDYAPAREGLRQAKALLVQGVKDGTGRPRREED